MAVSCPSGVREIIDCQSLMEGAGACLEGSPPGRPWDVSRACVAKNGAGCADSCNGDRLSACHRGNQVGVMCSDYGLKPCEMVTHVNVTRPARKKP